MKTSLSNPTSSTLIHHLQGSDSVSREEAWRRLTHIYGPAVYCRARRASLQSQDAADVVQEVFRAVAKNMMKFRRDRTGGSFGAWLQTITRNKINDYYRRMKKEEMFLLGDEAEERPISDSSESSKRVRRPSLMDVAVQRVAESVRAEFQERTWQAFWATAIEGKTAEEAGEALGMKAGAVRNARYKVIRRLREELEFLEL